MANGHRRRNVATSPMRQPRAGGTETNARARLQPATEPLDAVRAWRQLLDRPLFVYFIQDGDDGPVKIGKAHDPKSRLAELQCGNPRELHLRAVVLATDTTEATLHSRWGAFRVQGEWFLRTEELLDLACEVQRQQAKWWEARATGHGIAQMAETIIFPSVRC